MYPTIRNSLLTFASATQLDEHAIFIPKETRLSLQTLGEQRTKRHDLGLINM